LFGLARLRAVLVCLECHDRRPVCTLRDKRRGKKPFHQIRTVLNSN
jgi:hypothetical protein